MNARACRLFVVVLIAVVTVPRMTERGMFGDGLMYATISRNLAAGIGSFWAPAYTESAPGPFFEAPPLGFGLEAIAFRIAGESPATERLYSLTAFALTALIIVSMWRRLLPADVDWAPLLFWVQPSIVTWAVVNNMLENTQAVFTTAAVWLLMIAAAAPSGVTAVVTSAMAGLAVVAAVLTKGPVGLFPLVVPAVLRVTAIDRSTRRALANTATMGAVVAAAAIALALYPPSRHALSHYWTGQVVASLEGARETNPDPLALLPHFWLGIGARMGTLSLIVFAIGWRSRRVVPVPWRPATFFLLVALASSMPIFISPKIAGHYFLPSTPLFALAFGALTLPPLAALARSASPWARRVPIALALILAVTGVTYVAARGVYEPRDRDLIADLDAIGTELPRGAIIGACAVADTDWRLQSYLSRYFALSLDPHDRPRNGWMLDIGRACTPAPPCRMAAKGQMLTLYRCGD